MGEVFGKHKWQSSGRVDGRVILQATKFWASCWESHCRESYGASKVLGERGASHVSWRAGVRVLLPISSRPVTKVWTNR
jgi:hypothetical protein